jgi:triacylglycerol lipase
MILVSVIKEALFVIFYILSAAAGYFITLESVNPTPSKDTRIVFIHGWMTQNPLYIFLKRHLEKHGYQVYMTNFGLQTGDMNKMAVHLEEYFQERELDNIILIGASGGAIIAFVYLQKMDGWKRVRKFISIGGPFKGSVLAYLAPFSTAARQMSPNNSFLNDLSVKGILNAERITCIAAKYDELLSTSSSVLPGTNSEVLDEFGHVNLQAFSRQMYSVLVDHLGT